ncbi:CHASE domain-containing protein [Janthinobacterium fluminis]|uniref:diguanylate cyclase n=1 Tax=Janthinobacterium fluminis TaxID=2987524 RepID=A0ABT5K6W4_9BURK|nr:CHASE domain-containing protein [Janthinobacterium fluminis]MDC8760734.1 CHASE domain-containing protein [Janthinobacterium fluminis]
MNKIRSMPPAVGAIQDWLGPRFLSCLILCACLGFTYGAWRGAADDAERQMQGDFDFRARELLGAIAARMQTYIQVLYGVQGLYASSDFVDRAEFRHYLSLQQMAQHFPGIQGIGYMRLVPRAQRDAHVAMVRREGFPDYAVKPGGERELYAPVVYLEPFDGSNLRAFGYDGWYEPVRRATLERARDTGQATLSARLRLVQDGDGRERAGFLVALPVYDNQRAHATLAQRRETIRGWVYAPFHMEDLMAGLGGVAERVLDLEIYDGDAVAAARRMYDGQPGAAAGLARSMHRQIDIAGRRWTVLIGAGPGFDRSAGDKPRILAWAGVLLSFGLAVLTWLLARSRADARAALRQADLLTAQRRAGEARFRSLYDNAPVALWQQDWSAVHAALAAPELAGVADLADHLRLRPELVARLAAQVRIVGANGAARAQAGAGDAAAALSLAQNFDAAALPAFARAVVALAQGAQLFACEGSFVRLDGVARQNELTLLVMPGHEHSLDFVIVTTLDITERKRMNDELVLLATTDFLTGLPNRRQFMARLDDEHARLQRDIDSCASVLMLDLDHFKTINDGHGHAVGDAVLRHVAALMLDGHRKVDTLGRLGGEEFVILLPGTDLAAAGVLAERLRQRIAATPLEVAGGSIAVTVSIGIAAMRRVEAGYDGVLVRADKALYCAKKGGRNRVETEGGAELGLAASS